MSEDLMVEVGPRSNPSILELRKDLLTNGDIVYLDKRQDTGLKKEIDSLNAPGKQVVVQADAANIPMADNSAGLIYARNLFGSKGTNPYNSRFGYNQSEVEKVGDTGLIAKEWFRAISNGGKVVVAETATPEFTSFEEIDSAFLDAGFTRQSEDLYKRGEQVLLQEDAQEVVGSMTREEARKALDHAYVKGSYTVIYTKPQ